VPEFLQRDCTPQNLGNALVPLLAEGPQRRRQIDAFERLDAIMGIDASKAAGWQSPSQRAADIVLGLARPRAIEDGKVPG